jgi:RNA polymerase-binding transcription factor DksA
METAKEKLEKERDAILAEMGHLRQYVEHDAEIEIDVEEGDPEVFEQEKDVTLLEALEPIHDALRSLEKGTYGICERCGNEIDPARLEALPDARLCIKCKTLLEKMGKPWL